MGPAGRSVAVEVTRQPSCQGGSLTWAVIDLDTGASSTGRALRALISMVADRRILTWDAAVLARLAPGAVEAASGCIDVRTELNVLEKGRAGARQRTEVPDWMGSHSREAHALYGRNASSEEDLRPLDAARWLVSVWSEMVRRGTSVSKNGELRAAYAALIGRAGLLGIPVDEDACQRLAARGPASFSALVRSQRIDPTIFFNGGLDAERAAKWAHAQGVVWPRSPDGRALADVDLVEDIAGHHPKVASLITAWRWSRILRARKLPEIRNGRVASKSAPMATRTSRDIPDSHTHVFTWPKAARRVIRPTAERAVVFVDMRGADVGIAAGLSRDPMLLRAAATLDPYAHLARELGTVKVSRDVMKRATLACLYGVGDDAFARVLGGSPERAHAVRRAMLKRLSAFFAWQDDVLVRGRNGGVLRTPLGWCWQPTPEPTPRFRYTTARLQ